MEKEHFITITDGSGSIELVSGNYDVEADVKGYDNNSITPDTQAITDGVDEYNFTIAAEGTLTIHVSDDGTDTGTPVVGAEFYRCDSEGNPYGDPVKTDNNGNAILEHVPFSPNGDAPEVYFKQTDSDGQHNYSTDTKDTKLNSNAETIQLANTPAATRTIKLTDTYYSGLPIANGTITFTSK